MCKFLNIMFQKWIGVDKLISKRKVLRGLSYTNLRKQGEFLAVSRSALGKEYTDNNDKDDDAGDVPMEEDV